MTKYLAALLEHPIAFTVGTTATTDVLLPVSMTHLLDAGAEAFD